MQPQLKPVSGARLWRTLALTLSVTTLTLALCPKPQKFQEKSARTAEAEAAAPAPIGGAALPGLSQPENVRASADSAALASLIAIVQRGEPKLVAAALEGIAQIGGDQAREFLVRRFHAAANAELPGLASALATLGDAPARAVLQSAARSARPVARSAAFDALTTLDTADVREFMLQALNFVEPSPAASYFSNCREPRALPALERLARLGDADQRQIAVNALFAQGAIAEEAIARLLREDDELCDALLQGQPATPFARQSLRRAGIARLRAGGQTTGWVFEFLQRDLSREAREALVQAARDPASTD
ncbi:MAG TPA: hypothetical protein VGC79_35920, partial [Polyangiaceae bacterium]